VAELKATKTRLTLLQAVAHDEVKQHRFPGYPSEFRWRQPAGRSRIVTARIGEMERAGWVEVGSQVVGRSMSIRSMSTYSTRPVLLTDAGAAVLAASKETAS
jgi:hypothetical protein